MKKKICMIGIFLLLIGVYIGRSILHTGEYMPCISVIGENGSIKSMDEPWSMNEDNMVQAMKLDEIMEASKLAPVLIMGETGGYGFIENKGYFQIDGDYVDYVYPDDNRKIEKVIGAWMNPPKDSLMKTYDDMLSFLKNDEKTLVLYLDGFGYHQYIYAVENGYAPFLKKIDKGNAISAVYKPVTNAGFAAMITGKTPSENGVYSRKFRDLKVPSIFGRVKDLHKKALFIEGDIKILNTEIEPLLNIDTNKDGTIDDEIFEVSLEHIDKGYDLVMIHFHSIDDSGHHYGDLSKETMERIKSIDKYIEMLMYKWSGNVIITADHGMHAEGTAGNHGDFRVEDLLIPYILIKGEGDK